MSCCASSLVPSLSPAGFQRLSDAQRALALAAGLLTSPRACTGLGGAFQQRAIAQISPVRPLPLKCQQAANAAHLVRLAGVGLVDVDEMCITSLAVTLEGRSLTLEGRL